MRHRRTRPPGPRSSPPPVSWWVGVDRETFLARLADRLPALERPTIWDLRDRGNPDDSLIRPIDDRLPTYLRLALEDARRRKRRRLGWGSR